MWQAEITVAPHHPDLPRWPRRRLAVLLNLEVAKKWRPLQLLPPFSGQLQHGAPSLQHLQLPVSTLRILLGNLSLVNGLNMSWIFCGHGVQGLPCAVSDSSWFVSPKEDIRNHKKTQEDHGRPWKTMEDLKQETSMLRWPVWNLQALNGLSTHAKAIHQASSC